MFEVVFDYGEGHYGGRLAGWPATHFLARAPDRPPDGITLARSSRPILDLSAPGFEVRTYRLCHRVLMFHHFPHELGINDLPGALYSVLVRTKALLSRLLSPVSPSRAIYASQSRTQPNRYLKQSLPPLEFELQPGSPAPNNSPDSPSERSMRKSLENLPIGLDGASYQLGGTWTAKALAGILTEQAEGWYYKRNLGAKQLGARGWASAHRRPLCCHGGGSPGSQPFGLGGGGQFLDLAGDGQVDLVQMEGSVRGFYEAHRRRQLGAFFSPSSLGPT